MKTSGPSAGDYSYDPNSIEAKAAKNKKSGMSKSAARALPFKVSEGPDGYDYKTPNEAYSTKKGGASFAGDMSLFVPTVWFSSSCNATGTGDRFEKIKSNTPGVGEYSTESKPSSRDMKVSSTFKSSQPRFKESKTSAPGAGEYSYDPNSIESKVQFTLSMSCSVTTRMKCR